MVGNRGSNQQAEHRVLKLVIFTVFHLKQGMFQRVSS